MGQKSKEYIIEEIEGSLRFTVSTNPPMMYTNINQKNLK